MVASEQHLYQTIVLPRKLATGSIHDYLFCYCPLVRIIFEVLRIKIVLVELTVKHSVYIKYFATYIGTSLRRKTLIL